MSSLYITKGLDGLQIEKCNGEVSLLVFLDLCWLFPSWFSFSFWDRFLLVACASLELMVILLPEPPRGRFLSHHAQLQSLSSKAFHSPRSLSLPSISFHFLHSVTVSFSSFQSSVHDSALAGRAPLCECNGFTRCMSVTALHASQTCLSANLQIPSGIQQFPPYFRFSHSLPHHVLDTFLTVLISTMFC